MMGRVFWRRYALLLCLSICSFVLYAQSYLTGVNTRTPTERLDINGTFRVRELPAAGEKYYNGSSTTVPSSSFPQVNYPVVVDQNGVLGKMRGLPPSMFYMPPIMLPLTEVKAEPEEYDSSTETFNIDLYTHYKRQFGFEDATTSFRIPTSTNSRSFLPVWEADRLDFFVIYYDPEVFENVTVSDAGILSYQIKEDYNITDNTYMNIIFRVKSI